MQWSSHQHQLHAFTEGAQQSALRDFFVVAVVVVFVSPFFQKHHRSVTQYQTIPSEKNPFLDPDRALILKKLCFYAHWRMKRSELFASFLVFNLEKSTLRYSYPLMMTKINLPRKVSHSKVPLLSWWDVWCKKLWQPTVSVSNNDGVESNSQVLLIKVVVLMFPVFVSPPFTL